MGGCGGSQLKAGIKILRKDGILSGTPLPLLSNQSLQSVGQVRPDALEKILKQDEVNDGFSGGFK